MGRLAGKGRMISPIPNRHRGWGLTVAMRDKADIYTMLNNVSFSFIAGSDTN